MHITKGKTLAQSISDRTDYGLNPEKTKDGELTSAYACDPRSFAAMPGFFDVIVADVPCSGMGVIRKKPDIRYKNLSELERLPEIQIRILNNLCRYVCPGGVLLYSTCTILKRENEE